MRTLLTALLVLVSVPAMATECVYRSADGWTFSVENRGESEYRLTPASAPSTVCAWMQSDEGTGVRLACDDGTTEFVTPGDVVLEFGGRIYSRECE